MKPSAFLTLFSTLFVLTAASRHNALPRAHLTKKCKPRPASPAPPLPSQSNVPGSTNAGGDGGVIQVVDSSCGPSNATPNTTATTGPNGGIDWINCDLDSAEGWHPPNVLISDLVYIPLETAMNAWPACKEFESRFEKYGNEFNIPGTLLASFAMQESTCSPDAVGLVGEQGLMQLSPDKCVAAPGGNCQDLDYNIGTAAKFFADTLQSHNNSVFESIGSYNGFSLGMTSEGVIEKGKTCCRCQCNLDYVFQFVNGWLQGVNAHDPNNPLGKYFNLKECGL